MRGGEAMTDEAAITRIAELEAEVDLLRSANAKLCADLQRDLIALHRRVLALETVKHNALADYDVTTPMPEPHL